jgi:hypothetical protein
MWCSTDISQAINSKAFQSRQDLNGSPILLLDATSRIAFVIHHLQGYKIRQAILELLYIIGVKLWMKIIGYNIGYRLGSSLVNTC